LKKVAEVYDWLDLQISNNGLAGQCDACGRCCDFAPEQGFDHRLFLTPPELMYLAANQTLEPMLTSSGSTKLTTRCPYNIDGKCSVYKYRFAGCRIFYCRGNVDFQTQLSESALKKFKTICTEFQVPYRYIDLATALSSD